MTSDESSSWLDERLQVLFPLIERQTCSVTLIALRLCFLCSRGEMFGRRDRAEEAAGDGETATPTSDRPEPSSSDLTGRPAPQRRRTCRAERRLASPA